jgi:putative hydrolase of the HAD superfamily
MDGTILDRHFDDHFWLEHVPKRYAEKTGMPIEEAKPFLYSLFRSQEETLNWTDLDYWSERLGLDIPVLKHEVDQLIAVHPGVMEFISFLRRHGKAIWLVTNAHAKTLTIKMRKTRLGHWFTGIVSAHDLGLPKEDDRFWGKLRERIIYDPARTLLGEDSETNLGTAARYGIRYLIYVARFSSTAPPGKSERFTSIHYFSQLIPQEGDTGVAVTLQKPL